MVTRNPSPTLCCSHVPHASPFDQNHRPSRAPNLIVPVTPDYPNPVHAGTAAQLAIARP